MNSRIILFGLVLGLVMLANSIYAYSPRNDYTSYLIQQNNIIINQNYAILNSDLHIALPQERICELTNEIFRMKRTNLFYAFHKPVNEDIVNMGLTCKIIKPPKGL